MMTKIKGIDVSHHNGTIDWKKVKKRVDFAIIRAGYGKGNVDKRFYENSIGCESNNIPYGYYWFSYAYTPEMAKKEADYCCDLIKVFSPTYPICFDFEYGSLKYAEKHGYKLSSTDIIAICKAFLDRVEERGYFAMFYSNPDFLENYELKTLIKRYALWVAKWGNNPPPYNYGIWQTGTGTVEGINGEVDINYSLRNYHDIISALYKFSTEQKIRIAMTMTDEWWNKYVLTAKRALNGIYDDIELDKICHAYNMDINLVNAIIEALYE